jgi:hypothetical protein
MKRKIYCLLVLILSLGLLCTTLQAQQTSDPDEIEREFTRLEAKNFDEMSSSVQALTREELAELYKSYIEAVGKQISLLEQMPDPRGRFKKKRDEYSEKRGAVQNRLNDILKKLDGKTSETVRPAQPVKEGRKPTESRSGGGVDNSGNNQNNSSQVTIKTDSNTFTEATPVIKGAVDEMVAIIECRLVDCDQSGETFDESITTNFVEAFSFTSALAIEPAVKNDEAIFSLKPISYAFETARTDKQIGASASTTASTSQIDKPGFATLLGAAIENGLVEKNVQDSVLTLSTSPAALFSIGAEDYQTAYKNAGIFNNIGLTASFNINSQNTLLANTTRGQLREYSVRYNFFDRSARSPEFQAIFDTEIAPKIKAQLNAVGTVKEFVDSNEAFRGLRNASRIKLINEINKLKDSNEFKALTKEKKKESLTNIIFNFLKSEVFTKLQGGSVQLTDADKTTLRQKMSNLLKVQKETVFTAAREQLDAFYQRPAASVAYLNHRDPLGNYSEFKFLYQQSNSLVKPLELVFNTGFSFYHKPNRMANQQKIRDINVALSFEGKIRAPWLETENMSKITYSFTGRYTRMFENKGIADRKADLGSFQFLTTFPFLRGLSLPLSVTYSNATETERKSGVRFNFGLKLDTDKLFELARIDRLLNR